MKNIFNFKEKYEVYWWARVIKVLTFAGTIIVFGFAAFLFSDNSYQLTRSNCINNIKVYDYESSSYGNHNLLRRENYEYPIMGRRVEKDACLEYEKVISLKFVLRNTVLLLLVPVLFFLFMRFAIYESVAYMILGNKK